MSRLQFWFWRNNLSESKLGGLKAEKSDAFYALSEVKNKKCICSKTAKQNFSTESLSCLYVFVFFVFLYIARIAIPAIP